MFEVKKENKENKLETDSTFTVEYIDYEDGFVSEKTTTINTRTFPKEQFLEEISREEARISRIFLDIENLKNKKNALNSIVIGKEKKKKK